MTNGDGARPPGFWRRASTVFASWQGLLTLVVGAATLWFNHSNDMRRQYDINKAAIEAAEDRRSAFYARPDYTLLYFENAFPPHAYCAALATFHVAATTPDEGGPAGGDRATRAEALDAIGRELDRLARELDLDIETLRADGERRAARVVDALGRNGAEAASVACDAEVWSEAGFPWGWVAEPGRLKAQFFPSECLRALGLYKKSACTNRVRAAQAVLLAELGAGAAAERATVEAPPRPSRSADPEPVVEAPAEPGEAGSGAPPGIDPDAGPCPAGEGRPAVYPHRVSLDEAEAERIVAALRALGWRMEALEAVPKARTAGDVRYYYPDQIDCAERLARETAGAMPAGLVPQGGLATVDLSKAYRNLPRGRMELWLP